MTSARLTICWATNSRSRCSSHSLAGRSRRRCRRSRDRAGPPFEPPPRVATWSSRLQPMATDRADLIRLEAGALAPSGLRRRARRAAAPWGLRRDRSEESRSAPASASRRRSAEKKDSRAGTSASSPARSHCPNTIVGVKSRWPGTVDEIDDHRSTSEFQTWSGVGPSSRVRLSHLASDSTSAWSFSKRLLEAGTGPLEPLRQQHQPGLHQRVRCWHRILSVDVDRRREAAAASDRAAWLSIGVGGDPTLDRLQQRLLTGETEQYRQVERQGELAGPHRGRDERHIDRGHARERAKNRHGGSRSSSTFGTASGSRSSASAHAVRSCWCETMRWYSRDGSRATSGGDAFTSAPFAAM